MELVELIIYLGRLRSAQDDARMLAEHEGFRKRAADLGVELDRMIDDVETAIRAKPGVNVFMVGEQLAPPVQP